VIDAASEVMSIRGSARGILSQMIYYPERQSSRKKIIGAGQKLSILVNFICAQGSKFRDLLPVSQDNYGRTAGTLPLSVKDFT
jgi:hypothetical protein